MLKVRQTPTFERAVKKLHRNEKVALDDAIRAILASPLIGQLKTGDLAGVRVFKYSSNKQEILLAYRLMPDEAAPVELIFLQRASHENFYRELKRTQ